MSDLNFIPIVLDKAPNSETEAKSIYLDFVNSSKLAFLKLFPDFLLKKTFLKKYITTKDNAFTNAMDDLDDSTNIVKIIRKLRAHEASIKFLLNEQQFDYVQKRCKHFAVNPDASIDEFGTKDL